MKISHHLEKAAAFEQAVAKLDPVEDTELFIVFLMRAGTNRVNAALHSLGLTTDVTGGSGGKVGDLNHTYKPELDVALPVDMAHAFKHLAFLEDLRPEFVRGPGALDEGMVEACRAAYAEIREKTDSVINTRVAS